MRRSLSRVIAASAAFMLIALPAFAQETSSASSSAASSESSVSSSSSTSSTSSSSAGSVSSASSSRKMNLGRHMKDKCMELKGLARVSCVHSVNTPKGLVKKAMKKARAKTTEACSAHEQATDAYKACMEAERNEMKEQRPNGARFMDHIKGMRKHRP